LSAWCKTIVTTLFYIEGYISFATSLLFFDFAAKTGKLLNSKDGKLFYCKDRDFVVKVFI